MGFEECVGLLPDVIFTTILISSLFTWAITFAYLESKQK